MSGADPSSISTQSLPPGASDCHMHVFGDSTIYPLSSFRSYSVGEAPLAAYQALQKRLGLERVVFVQASGYHTDNRCMLDTMEELGPSCRGVAVIDETIAPAELKRMHGIGVRAIRINLVSVGSFTAQQAWENVTRLASLIADLGWHVQVFASPAQLAELGPLLGGLAVPVIVDHMGLPSGSEGIEQPGFQQLLRLLGEGRCWAKLSGADRITRGEADMTGAGRFARALLGANPDNLVWGSDWPHIGWHSSAVHSSDDILPFRSVDEGALLGLLAAWAPDPAVRTRVLVDNPARLYGF